MCDLGVMDVVRGSHPQKISMYNINRATVRSTDNSPMYRQMAPFIAGKAEEWVIKVIALDTYVKLLEVGCTVLYFIVQGGYVFQHLS